MYNSEIIFACRFVESILFAEITRLVSLSFVRLQMASRGEVLQISCHSGTRIEGIIKYYYFYFKQILVSKSNSHLTINKIFFLVVIYTLVNKNFPLYR